MSGVVHRTWAYGERKACAVVSVEVLDGWRILACESAGEGFILLDRFRPGDPRPGAGDRGTLVFTEGGPTGGHWRYEPDGEGV